MRATLLAIAVGIVVAGCAAPDDPPAPAAVTIDGPAYADKTKRALLESLPAPMFEEITGAVGLDFVHRSDPDLRALRARLSVPVGIAGGGVAAADYDGDGFDDLFFAGGGGGRLYRNDGGRRLVDATLGAGLDLEGESRAPYFVDYDNDGDLDLFVTFAWLPDRLFDNVGGGRFRDVTRDVGLGVERDMTHEAVWFDMDGDGLLEIYTANFGPWPDGAVPEIGQQNFNGGPNRLYRHRLVAGRHRFEEIGAAAGVDDRGWTHAVGAWDVDDDGRADLFSLNDFGRGSLYRNLGDGRFVEASLEFGLEPTYNAMGFSLVDLDGNGTIEAYVSELAHTVRAQGRRARVVPQDDPREVFDARVLQQLARTVNNRLYERSATGTIENRHAALLEPAEMGWAWDASAFDYENDGDSDLLVLNGTDTRPPRLPDEARRSYLEQARFVQYYADESNVMFVAEGGFLYNVSSRCEPCYVGNSRGSAVFDFDGDGDLDLAINDYEAPARLYRNAQTGDRAWVRLRLEGTRSNRNGIGARVTIIDDRGRRRTAEVVSGSGFLSQDPPELHFGLGDASEVTDGEIVWPSGTTQRTGRLDARRLHVVREPHDAR